MSTVRTEDEAPRGRKLGMSPENRIRVWLGDWRVVLSSSRQFGVYFFVAAIVGIVGFLLYAQLFVVLPIRQEARRDIERYAFFYSIATRDTIIVPQAGPSLEIIFETIQNTNFPVVITDEQGRPRYWKAVGVAWGDQSPEARSELRKIIARLDQENRPLPFENPNMKLGPDNKPVSRHPQIWVLHYGDSALVKRLAWLPFVALFVTLLIIAVGYAGFRHIRNSEQRSIWVGMARETAHQLGTPLSSLYGWLELMKSEVESLNRAEGTAAPHRFDQILVEMDQDTNRLNKIASRFSQIGSTPELRLGNLDEVVGETAAYLRHRLPSDVKIVTLVGGVPPLPMNRELLGWAFENLFKNAADAMEGKPGGRIEIATELHPDGNRLNVLVRDNGKGIPSHHVKQVFLPGYSTKKRGWGLGLAFVKRIIEDYHRGRILVRESALGKGTTFQLSLPLSPDGDQSSS